MSAYLDDVLLLGLNEGLEGLDAGGGGGVGVHQQQVLIQVEDSTKLLKYLKICLHLYCKKNPIYVLPEKKLRSLSPNIHNHVSVIMGRYIQIAHRNMNVGISVSFLGIRYLFRIFGILSLQCAVICI